MCTDRLPNELRIKTSLWAMIKNDNEVYARLISDTGLVESELERRVLKLLTSVPSVEDDTLAENAVTGEALLPTFQEPTEPSLTLQDPTGPVQPVGSLFKDLGL